MKRIAALIFFVTLALHSVLWAQVVQPTNPTTACSGSPCLPLSGGPGNAMTGVLYGVGANELGNLQVGTNLPGAPTGQLISTTQLPPVYYPPANIWTQTAGVIQTASGGGSVGSNQEPTVIYDTNPQILSNANVFKMWYSCQPSSTEQICYAESPDGVNWTQYASNPVISSGRGSFVIKNAGTYYLYVLTGIQCVTPMAVYTSANGVTFTLSSASVVSCAGTETGLGNVSVIADGSNFDMLLEVVDPTACSGANAHYCTKALTSTSLTSGWSRISTTYAYFGSGPALFKTGSAYYSWGHMVNGGGTCSSLFRWSSATFGTGTWTANPVQQTMPNSLTNESCQMADSTLVNVGNTTYEWYSASANANTSYFQINLATTPNTLAQVESSSEAPLYPGATLVTPQSDISPSVIFTDASGINYEFAIDTLNHRLVIPKPGSETTNNCYEFDDGSYHVDCSTNTAKQFIYSGSQFEWRGNSAGGSNLWLVDVNGMEHFASTAPSASAGSVTGTNQGGQITGLSTATTTTLTFANSGWTTWASCVANASTSTALPYVSAISKTSVTFTFVSLTGSLYYHCDGN